MDAARVSPRGGRAIALLLVLVGCAKGVEDPNGTTAVLSNTGVDGNPDGDTDDTGGTAGTDDGASGQVEGSGSSGGLDSTTGGSGLPGTADASSSDDGPPPVCPIEADDVPCEVCGKEQCCAEYLACIDDAACTCALDCYLAGVATGDCFVMCGASNPALDLFNCAAPACDGICT